jgi:hypothetical protein
MIMKVTCHQTVYDMIIICTKHMMVVVSKWKKTSRNTDYNFLVSARRSSQSSSSPISWNRFLSTFGSKFCFIIVYH